MCAQKRRRWRAQTVRSKPTKQQTSAVDSHAGQIRRLLRWFLPNERIFTDLPRHGNSAWSPQALVWLALCWAWDVAPQVTDAFENALDHCHILRIDSLPATYQGFMNILAVWTERFLEHLWPLLHQRMQQIGGAHWRVGPWVPIAFDGSRSTAPRTESNEQALCAANYGQGKTARYRKKKSKGMRRRKNERNKPQPQEPQAWITLLWHMGLRLPWTWRLGPSNASERAHVMELLESGHFPKNTLFCGDAGFVGYPLWSLILSSGHDFMVRVGANVHLLRDTVDFRWMGGGAVLCWPREAFSAGLPPLRLRLVRVRLGREWMWMLTSVRDPSRLSNADIVRLYKLRWGVEVEFRGLKQTLNRAKLRCRNSRRLMAELHWSILAMAVAELFALKEQLRACRVQSGVRDAGDPGKRSLAQTMRALRWSLAHLERVPARGKDLRSRLRRAVTDDYVRKGPKHARYRPRNPDKKPLGHPTVRKLNLGERRKLKTLEPERTAA